MNRVNTIINAVKSHLIQYNFIEIDFEIVNRILVISIYPRYEFIHIVKEIDKILLIIENELDTNIPDNVFRKDYQINVYKTLNNYINR